MIVLELFGIAMVLAVAVLALMVIVGYAIALLGGYTNERFEEEEKK